MTLTNKLVALTVNSEDVLRVTGIKLNLLPQPRYMNVDSAGSGHGVVAPDFIEQFIPGESGTSVADKIF